MSTTMTAPTTPAHAEPLPHRQFLIVNNVQKAKNIKNMLVSASSFGVTEVFIVGQKKFELHDHDTFLRSLHCPVTRMASLVDCRAHCVANNIRIVGVEIMENAQSILDEPFQGDTAFIMGNEVRFLYEFCESVVIVRSVTNGLCYCKCPIGKRYERGPGGDLRRVRDHPAVRRRHRVAQRDGRGFDHHAQLRGLGQDPCGGAPRDGPSHMISTVGDAFACDRSGC